MSDDSATGRNEVQLPLPLIRQDDYRQLIELLLSRETDLTPEQVESHVMVLYQIGLGPILRVLSQLKPTTASRVLKQISKDFEFMAKQFDLASGATETALQDEQPLSVQSLSRKNVTVIRREVAILRRLLSTDRTIKLSELLELLQDKHQLPDATLTANLDRMANDGRLLRPSKGYYTKGPRTREYLSELERELARRGEDE